MSDRNWKKQERRVATLLNGDRSSKVGKSSPDVTASWVIAEVKDRKSLPKWIKQGLGKVRIYAGSSRLGILVLHETRSHDRIVLMSLKDFRDWFGGEGKCRKTEGSRSLVSDADALKRSNRP